MLVPNFLPLLVNQPQVKIAGDINKAREAEAAARLAMMNSVQAQGNLVPPQAAGIGLRPGQAGLALGLGLLGNILERGAGTQGLQGMMQGLDFRRQQMDQEAQRQFQVQQQQAQANTQMANLGLQFAGQDVNRAEGEREDFYKRQEDALRFKESQRRDKEIRLGQLRGSIGTAKDPETLDSYVKDYNRLAKDIGYDALGDEAVLTRKAEMFSKASEPVVKRYQKMADERGGFLSPESMKFYNAFKLSMMSRYGVTEDMFPPLETESTLRSKLDKLNIKKAEEYLKFLPEKNKSQIATWKLNMEMKREQLRRVRQIIAQADQDQDIDLKLKNQRYEAKLTKEIVDELSTKAKGIATAIAGVDAQINNLQSQRQSPDVKDKLEKAKFDRVGLVGKFEYVAERPYDAKDWQTKRAEAEKQVKGGKPSVDELIEKYGG